VLVYDEDSGEKRFLASDAVNCASGGYGQLYQYTTNPRLPPVTVQRWHTAQAAG
jgi:aspartate oxidase